MSTMTPVRELDGHWYIYNGYDAAGRVIRQEVPDPTPAPPSALTPFQKAKAGLLYREPVHGHWYQSPWMWFWLASILPLVLWWSTIAAEVDDGTSLGRLVAVFGWLMWAWMPLGLAGIGALQKEGYRRLAVAWSAIMFAAITAFFSRNDKSRR